MPIDSILDVGCARGTWLSVWRENGVIDFLGIDGEHVKMEHLCIESNRFAKHDLGQAFRLGRTFDLVQCLEVAEHLERGRARSFVADLAAHSQMVLFSAAPPGQGGKWHVNEQPYSYWRSYFADEGFILFDCIRPLLRHRAQVAPWYRFNVFLFVQSSAVCLLPPFVRLFELDARENVADVAPALYRVRKFFIRILPFWVRQLLAEGSEMTQSLLNRS